MSGIIINEMENIENEFVPDGTNPNGVNSLRERTKKEYSTLIQELEQIKKQKQKNKNQTSITTSQTQNGIVTQKKTVNDNNEVITETFETDDANLNNNETVNQNETFIHNSWQKEQLDKGIDISDISDGKEDEIPNIPNTAQEDPNNANKNTNSKNENEHCVIDETFESNTQESENGGDLSSTLRNQLNDLGLKGTKCTDPDETGLNDLQKQLIWVAIDMLKWQPITDVCRGKVSSKNKPDDFKPRKRQWEYTGSTPEGHTQSDPFYSNYAYPNDLTFGMHSDVKGFPPLVRLKKFYNGMGSNNASNIKDAEVGWTTPWCAQTISVIYAFAMASLKVKNKKYPNIGTRVCINKYKDNPSIVPFLINAESRTLCISNAKKFGYNVSWEPTVGSIKMVTYGNKDGGCGHVAIVLYVTEEKDILVAEGNGGEDYSLRFWKRKFYYETSYKRMGHASAPAGHGKCSPGNASSGFKSILPERPTKSTWHSPFINPSISEDLEWTEKVSRPGNPLEEIKKMVNGFYNPDPRPDSNDNDFSTGT